MNEKTRNQNHPDLDGQLETAVWAVLSVPVPSDAVERVKQRARDAAADVARRKLVDKAKDAADASLPRLRILRIGTGLAIAASLMAIFLVTFFGSNDSLAQMIEASLSKRWVHSVTTHSRPQGLTKADDTDTDVLTSNVISESWYSSEQGILAVKMPGRIYFENRGEDLAVTYDAGSDTAMLTLPNPPELMPIEPGGNPLEQLRTFASSQQTKRFVVTDMTTEQLSIDNRSVTRVSFDLTQRGDPSSRRSCVIVFDEEVKLLTSMTETYSDGLRRETVFDYPETGPSDFVQAGIPESVVRMDRRASTDVRTLESKWTDARVNFDDYDAIVVQVPEDLEHSLTTGLNTDIKRVRRSGNRYRVDTLLSLKEPIEPPAEDTDLNQWWIQHRDRYWSVPSLICDGQTVTYYQMVDGRLRRDETPDLEVTLRNQHPVHGIGTDRPVAWPQLMPEFAARPHLSLSDPKRSFSYSATPEDGPEGAVRLVVTSPDVSTMEIHRYWLGPEVDLGVRRMVQPVFHNKVDSPEKAGEVAYIDSEVLVGYKQSPKGYWFPTRTERETSTSERRQLRTYHLDFDVDLDDTLFQPLDLQK